MIALYKDPKGESIFDKYEPPSLKTQPAVLNGQPQTQQQQHTDQSTTCTGTIDSLKKRIQELENMLSLNQQQAEPEVAILYRYACLMHECMNQSVKRDCYARSCNYCRKVLQQRLRKMLQQ